MASLKSMTKIADKIVADIKSLPDKAPPPPPPPAPVAKGKTKIKAALIANPIVAAAMEGEAPTTLAQLIATVQVQVDNESAAQSAIVGTKFTTVGAIMQAALNGVEPTGMKDVALAFLMRRAEKAGKPIKKEDVNQASLNVTASRFTSAATIAYKKPCDVAYILQCAFDYKAAYDAAAVEYVAANKDATVKPIAMEDCLFNCITVVKTAQETPTGAEAATPKHKAELAEHVKADIAKRIAKKGEADPVAVLASMMDKLKKFACETQEDVDALNAALLWITPVHARAKERKEANKKSK